MDIFDSFLQAILTVVVENTAVLLSWVFMAAVAVIATYYAYRSHQLAKQEIQKKPELNIFLYDRDLPRDIYFLVPFGINKWFEIPIQCFVTNIGEKVAERVELFWNLPDEYYRREMPRDTSNIVKAKELKHATDAGKTEHLTEVYFSIGDLGPNHGAKVADSIFIKKDTVARIEEKVKTKNNVMVLVKFNVLYAAALKIRTISRNSPNYEKKYSLHFRKSEKNPLHGFLKNENKLRKENSKEGSNQWQQNEEDADFRQIAIVYFEEYTKVPPIQETQNKPLIKIFRPNLDSINVTSGVIAGNDIRIPSIESRA